MIHLQPTAPLAERVLLPGDPGCALRLAQALIEGPKMFNHHRGLWGYSGPAIADGAPLTIQSAGMGGPSTAIVVHELIALGARRLMRVGTCGALADGLALGDLIVATAAAGLDGTSRALGAETVTAADPGLVTALHAAAADGTAAGLVVSSDVFYAPEPPAPGWAPAEALAVEMEAATLFTLGRLHGVPAGAVLAVSELAADATGRIGEEQLHAAEIRIGELALAALPAPAGASVPGDGAGAG